MLRLVLWGAGYHVKMLGEFLEKESSKTFIDNNSKFQGTCWEGIYHIF